MHSKNLFPSPGSSINDRIGIHFWNQEWALEHMIGFVNHKCTNHLILHPQGKIMLEKCYYQMKLKFNEEKKEFVA